MGRKAVAMMVTIWVVPTMILVNHIVPDPYMDEIFHIPQAQMYCSGNFKSWDPMITTPPGLYLFSLAYVTVLYPSMRFMNYVSSLSELCSTPMLRSSNAVLAVICSMLVYDIIIHLKPTLGERRTTLYATAASLYPLHWFFTFLYYTDVASVTAVLAMYLAALKQKYWTSAMFGGVAVLLRQTNIMWMLFILAIMIIKYAESFDEDDLLLDHKKKTTLQNVVQHDKITPKANLRRRRHECADHSKSCTSEGTSVKASYMLGFLDEIKSIFLKTWHLKWNILVIFGPYILIAIAFACFVVWNGSIVLGAKDAHTASLHFAQLMYFSLVSATVIAPVHFSTSNAASLYYTFSKNRIQTFPLLVLIIGFVSVHFFSIAHPYLLADNRHYTFYIWRKIINAHWSTRYLLVPLYAYSWCSIFNNLGKTQKKLWILLFFLACGAVLVPAPLIEFRYYTVPIFFMFFHSQIDRDISWIFMASAYIIVDVFTLIVFLFRPFQWIHEPGIQRFIW